MIVITFQAQTVTRSEFSAYISSSCLRQLLKAWQFVFEDFHCQYVVCNSVIDQAYIVMGKLGGWHSQHRPFDIQLTVVSCLLVRLISIRVSLGCLFPSVEQCNLKCNQSHESGWWAGYCVHDSNENPVYHFGGKFMVLQGNDCFLLCHKTLVFAFRCLWSVMVKIRCGGRCHQNTEIYIIK